MSIVPNDKIILSDYKIVNNELGIKIQNNNQIYELGYGFWFRYSLTSPNLVLSSNDLPAGIADLGGIYFSNQSGIQKILYSYIQKGN